MTDHGFSIIADENGKFCTSFRLPEWVFDVGSKLWLCSQTTVTFSGYVSVIVTAWG